MVPYMFWIYVRISNSWDKWLIKKLDKNYWIMYLNKGKGKLIVVDINNNQL